MDKEDGILVVKNPATPKFQGEILTLQEELTIGREDGRSEFVFSGINGIAVDDDGNICAIDDRDSQVRVFDKDGAYLRTIGRKGQGPGEFQRPLFVQFTADGELFVGDYAGRAVYFSRQGEYLRQKVMPRPILPIRQDSHGRFLGIEVAAPPPIGGKVIKKYDADFKPLQVIAKEEMGERGVFDIGKPSCYATMTSRDHIIWGDSRDYILYEVDPEGKLIKKITKDDGPQDIHGADREIYERRYAEPLRAGMRIRFRDHYPAFRNISADDSGRILVETFEQSEKGNDAHLFDIFDRDGIYIAKAALKVNLDRNSTWKKNKLYTVQDSPDGFPTIKRFAVKWNY